MDNTMQMRTTKCIMVAAAMAAIGGCQTAIEGPATGHDDNPFVGDWKGSNRFRPQIEARIEAVHEDRTVTGAACWWETSGVITGQRLDQIATQSETGLSIKFDIGKGSFHIQQTGERTATMWETRTRPDGTLTRPLRTRLTRTRKPACIGRYLATATERTPAPASAEQPLVGDWTGRWANGTIAEMNIAGTSARDFKATYCTRSRNGEIAIYDLQRRGRLKPRLDAPSRTLTFEERLRRGTRHFTFKAGAPKQATLERAYRKGRSRTGITKLTMTRGGDRDGCLAYIETQ